MKIEKVWDKCIEEMKKKMSNKDIVVELCHDRYFLVSNGFDYVNPPIRDLLKYIKTVET